MTMTNDTVYVTILSILGLIKNIFTKVHNTSDRDNVDLLL